MLQEVYLHPSGQIPAYEWNFGDVNPPVHAWATLFLYNIEQIRNGRRPISDFLKRCFGRLLLNFTWWVNRKDRAGQQRLRGRLPRAGQHRRLRPQRAACPPAATSSRRTARPGWPFFSQNMLEIAVELADEDPTYEPLVGKVRRALPVDRRRAEPRRRGTGCGTRRTASTTTSSGRRMAARRASRSARWSACCPSAPRRSSMPWHRERLPRDGCKRFTERLRRSPSCCTASIPPARATADSVSGGIARARQPGSAAPHPRADARRERSSSARTASARCPAITPSTPTSSRPDGQEYRVLLPSGRIGQRASSAATPTGEARSGCR